MRCGGSAAGHDVSIMSRSTRVRTADEKLEGFRARGPPATGQSRRPLEHV